MKNGLCFLMKKIIPIDFRLSKRQSGNISTGVYFYTFFVLVVLTVLYLLVFYFFTVFFHFSQSRFSSRISNGPCYLIGLVCLTVASLKFICFYIFLSSTFSFLSLSFFNFVYLFFHHLLYLVYFYFIFINRICYSFVSFRLSIIYITLLFFFLLR